MSIENPANNNPYSAPKSDLELDKTQGDVPSISEALSRGYDFSIGEVLSEAWGKINGCKGSIIGAGLVAYGLMLLVGFALGLVIGILAVFTKSPELLMVFNLLVNIVSTVLAYPLFAGVFLIGIRRAGGYPVRFNMVFACLNQAVPLLLTALLMNLVIYVPIGLLLGLAYLIGGFSGGLFMLTGLLAMVYVIYIGISYSLALPLVFERGLSPWQALETSRKAISQRWFKVFGLVLLVWLLMTLSAIPLMIGLIWTIPLMIVVFGVLYRTIFGVLPPAN